MNSLKNPGGGGNRFKNKPVTKEILTDMTELLENISRDTEELRLFAIIISE
jgi:hypothetical protein